ncbi:MAG: TVP38/TMEM64 family protein, partial [Gemmataceae bacterium]
MTKLWPRLALVAVLVALVAAFYATGLDRSLGWDAVRGQVAGWRDGAREKPALAALAFFTAYVAVAALAIPVALGLSLVAGAVFDFWVGLAVVSAGSTVGASLAFLASRYLFRDLVRRRLGPRLEPLDRGVERDGVWFLAWLRLTPVIPFSLINVGMGLTRMPLGRYALVSWLAMLPVTAVVVNAGRQLGRIERPADALSPAVVGSLALAGLTPLLLRWAGR